jgi:ABC-2 type transport system permease protein
MSTISNTARDSATMLRRELLHQVRYPSVTVMLVGMPVVFLLLFVYVVPGILLIAVSAVATCTAISIAMDMSEGIVARFRTMAISRAAVLAGHVAGSVIQTMIATAVVLVVAVAIGFRPHAGALEWLAALGLVAMVAFALTWLSVALGMVAQNVEAASNLPMPLLLLPFFGSGFVPTESLPPGLRFFAEHQPFTPIIETLRCLLTGAPVGGDAIVSAVWCAGIALVGYLWARASYDRRSVR